MPLEILAPMVVIGILAITLILHFLGHSSRHKIIDPAGEWRRHFPSDPALSTRVSDDKHAALVQTADGVGLLWTVGADTTARLIETPPKARQSNGVLIVGLDDFTAPKAKIVLGEKSKRVEWASKLGTSL